MRYEGGALYRGWIPCLKKVLPKMSPRCPPRGSESTRKDLPPFLKSTPKVLPQGPAWTKSTPPSLPWTRGGQQSYRKELKKISKSTPPAHGAASELQNVTKSEFLASPAGGPQQRPHGTAAQPENLPGEAGESFAALSADGWGSQVAPCAAGVLFEYFGNTF